MSFKKQTVNSAVSKLVKNGMLTLSTTNGNSKNKILMLTPEGREFAQRTVNQLLEAELKAAKKFGSKKLSSFCKLRDEYYGTLLREFEKDFLKD
jgi:DNA-binding MarR family transcriptional regulator